MKNILTVKNLSISYTNNIKDAVVQNASFEVNAGEIVAIVGGIGLGKSTIFNAITRRTDFSGKCQGEIEFLGKDIFKYSARELNEFRRQIGYAPQRDKADDYEPLWTANRVIENSLKISHANKRQPNDSVLIDKILKDFNISFKTNKLYRNLSGGQMRIITILSALVRDKARLYLIDEPVNNLDSETAKRLSNYLISEIKEKRPEAGILIITHCRMFPRIDRAYELKDRMLYPLDNYESKNCYGETDSSGLYYV